MTSSDTVLVDGRTRHYGEFYGVTEAPMNDDEPLLVVWGNWVVRPRLLAVASPNSRLPT